MQIKVWFLFCWKALKAIKTKEVTKREKKKEDNKRTGSKTELEFWGSQLTGRQEAGNHFPKLVT